MNRPSTPTILVVSLVLILLCCLFASILLFGSVALGLTSATPSSEGFSPFFSPSTSTPIVIRPEDPQDPVLVPSDTLKTLENTVIPLNEPLDLAARLEGKTDIPITVPPPSEPFKVGAQEIFWASNLDSNEYFKIPATLHYVTDHLYFWIEDGVPFDKGELQNLAETFESQIYSTTRAFFGSEWTPGVDGDPHLYVLLASGLGGSVAGYFTTNDEYHPLVREYSNAHEMFFLNADNLDLEDEFTYGVLAHEFQHMIHWYLDRNEDSWLNEGFSDLAMFLNGYTIGGHDYLYTLDPDIQLNDWPNEWNQTAPHYGASFLFLIYFLDKYGEGATRALVAHPDNGFVSIDAVLAELGARDPMTGKTIGADDVFVDWLVASYLQDDSIAEGRFSYEIYPNAPQPTPTETFASCPLSPQTREVNQYGVDYIQIACRGEHTLIFEGSTQVNVVPEGPYSGTYAFWSNKGDESDMTLTKTFDFRDHNAPLTLSYWTWYDIEEDYDYVYVLASVDGKTWEILTTPSGTDKDPTGNNYGWGYNGVSGNGPAWIQEEVDLSAFAGQEVQIRFEYLTDAAVNGEGFLLDDVAITETGYFTNFETDDGGWVANGFVRIQNNLPQTYRLALISFGDTTTIEQIPLTSDNRAELPLQLGDDVREAILVVTGTTRFTRQTAPYRIAIEP